jgi:hypothetical protein
LLGGGRTTSREDLQRSDCSEDSFSGELQHRFRVWCKGFSIRASSWQRASVQWFWQLVRRGTILGCISTIWTCVSAWFKLLLYQVHLFIVLVVFHLLFSTFIHSDSKLVFPGGGFIQGHVDQKYLCSFSCMLVFRTTLFQL